MTFEARRLSKTLRERTLYRDVSLSLEPGQTLAVRGPSGTGKSQLLRQLAGLESVSNGAVSEAGEVLFRDRGFEQWSPYEWRTQICYVPQHVPRLDGTPREFAANLARLREQRSIEAQDPATIAARFGITSVNWNQPWSELSIGERQRTLLATFLARRPAVLLLDEPTAALDDDVARAVEAQLADQTCVWVTHSAEQAARVADNILNLGDLAHAD